jgi:2,4-dienoyl-CoA reductase-like NADH-dependent reductase (Old Yellow Enzyme family)
MTTNSPDIFDSFWIKNVRFKNRLIRSSIGGRTAYYDGTVNESWLTFEGRFAKGGIAAIISATLTVDHDRWSPLEYPSLSHRRFVVPLAEKIRRIRAKYDCRYIVQLGDPGYHTQTSLIPEKADRLSSSAGFDLMYGYTNRRAPLSVAEIKKTIRNFADAAERVRDIGCDGLEITASKGYLIQQFLNPAINRRKDQYGGPLENRARLLSEIMGAIRERIDSTPDFVVGVRLSARDYSRRPWPAIFRLGPAMLPTLLRRDNRLEDMLEVGAWLKNLGTDYLHISNGFGFINPVESPGRFPTEDVRAFFNSNRHLSRKAALRALLLNLASIVPGKLALNRLLNLGWRQPYPPADPVNMVTNLDDAREFKRRVGIPVIVNGGFQRAEHIQEALRTCDLVSMARPLLANPDLPRLFEAGQRPKAPCTFCNRCSILTTVVPLGCYDVDRFRLDDEGRVRTPDEALKAMQEQIETFNRPAANRRLRRSGTPVSPAAVQPPGPVIVPPTGV